ncbi:MAG: NAD(P)-dependent oxidoreductase [Gammaproteobacteria bacterium]
MKIGFIGLGNVGGKLAGSLLRNGAQLTVCDLRRDVAAGLLAKGAKWSDSPPQLARENEMIITCLPSPAASAAVMEGGVIAAMSEGKLWAEMSSSDEDEVRRLGGMVMDKGAMAMDCPVSGGCHRAATGNIAIFAGCERQTFERALPVLKMMGRRILHTGALGSASALKVLTNYLASVNLWSVCEALATARAADINLNTAFEAMRISSGNSFVNETEGQVILNGSRDINFTMDLVVKDLSLFAAVAERAGISLRMLPLVQEIFAEGAKKYGAREWSPNIIRLLEEQTGKETLAPGFPPEITDDEPEEPGYEIIPQGLEEK